MNLARFDSRPIVACSTGSAQNSAIALIRLSGFKNWSVVAGYFSGSIGPLGEIEPRKAVYCKLVEGEKVTDHIVLTYYKEPHSFTGENVLELGIHGNQINVQRVLELLTQSGELRLAYPGEFTYRALKNDKLSLTEVEGLDLFLNAPSKSVLDQATKLMGGELTQAYISLRESFLKLKASVELALDFLEDVGEKSATGYFDQCRQGFSQKITALKSKVESPLSAILSPDIVLMGKPNTGKSSLFNRLLRETRAIVSPVEGTTRDFISEYISLQGIQFRLIDTAGVRDTGYEIEQEGVARSLKLMEQAFYKVLLINPATFDLSCFDSFRDLHFDLVLATFADQQKAIGLGDIPVTYDYYGYISLQSGPIEPVEVVVSSGPIEPLLSPEGPRALRQIEQAVVGKYLKLLGHDDILVPRQRVVIKECYQQFESIQQLIKHEEDMAIISSELNILGGKVEELVGLVPVEEVLEGVFARFCIGK